MRMNNFGNCMNECYMMLFMLQEYSRQINRSPFPIHLCSSISNINEWMRASLPQFRRILPEIYLACVMYTLAINKRCVRNDSAGVKEMNKKVLSMILAAVMLLTMTVTAFAAPDNTAAPAATITPTATANAASDAFLQQVKDLHDKVTALQVKLADERQYDRQIQAGINASKGIVEADKDNIKTFTKQLKEIDKKIAKLQRELAAAKKKHGKKQDPAAIVKIQSELQAAKDEKAALAAQYQPLIDQIHGNALGRRSLKPLRELLKPKYAELKPLFQASKDLSKSINAMIVDLKDAMQAGDMQKATDLVAQIDVKISQLESNINARIAIREEMKKILDDYKVNLQKV